jgi:serine/threonine protein kinase
VSAIILNTIYGYLALRSCFPPAFMPQMATPFWPVRRETAHKALKQLLTKYTINRLIMIVLLKENVFRRKGYDTKIDIWSLGIMVIELVDELPPLMEETGPMQAMYKIAAFTERPKGKRENEFSSDLVDFLDRCLQIQPEKRSTAVELLEHPFILKHEDSASLKPLIDEYYNKK